jgi:tryptophanyl-tRNA synthetase
MSLQEPTKKMSKSDPNEKATIFVLDPDDVIKSKIKRAVTDSGSEVKYDDNKPGVSNLIILYHIATGKTIEQIEQEFAGRGYGDFKPAVADAVAGYISPIRDRYIEIRKDKDYLAKVLKEGAEKASAQASRTLRKVYKKVGFVQF